MDNNKIYLILGANGLVGRSLSRKLKGKYKWYGTYYKREEPGLIKTDITSNDDLKKIFEMIKPDYVINCVNLAGGVDFCERNPDLAKKFHLYTNMLIGKLCDKYSSGFVFISTDYVFDGKNTPYKEDDKTNPLNLYGKLKLESEKWITKHVPNYLIVRTTNVFGWDPNTITPNYMMSLYRSIKDTKQFNAPSFLWGNPTYADDLASAIIELCIKEENGVFHIVGSSYINRYDWALKACKIAGWNTSLINEIKDAPKNIVPRPLKSNLSTDKFRSLCKTELNDVDIGLQLFVKKMKEETER